jgi:hypothetical protein
MTTTSGQAVSTGQARHPAYLNAIALKLRTNAAQASHGQAHHRLPRGLHIVFGIKEDARRLACGREAPSTPGEQEVEIVAKAFGVPEGAEPTIRQVEWRHRIRGSMVTFNVVELTWREREPACRGFDDELSRTELAEPVNG